MLANVGTGSEFAGADEETKTKIDTIKELARFLQVLGNKVEGRGVPKNDQTPAQR